MKHARSPGRRDLEPPRLSPRHERRRAGGPGRRRTPARPRRRAAQAPGAHRRHDHPALAGRRHGRARNVRPQAVHAVRSRRPVGEDPLHVPGDRHGASTASRSRRGWSTSPTVLDRGTLDPLARRRRPGQHPALAAPVPLAHRLRPAADRGRAAPGLVDRQGPRARGTRRSRPSSTSASGWRDTARSRSSRRSPPPGSSAASTARSISRIRSMRWPPCDRPRG